MEVKENAPFFVLELCMWVNLLAMLTRNRFSFILKCSQLFKRKRKPATLQNEFTTLRGFYLSYGVSNFAE